MTTPIAELRVGILGASAGNSWASRSHVPAVEAIPGLVLTSVATSRRETAAASAEQFGARNAFVGTTQLVTSDDVDLVIVAVKVPAHREMVSEALAAGKHVYCEWPLGVDLADAEFIADLARDASSRVAVGLQARSSPTLRYMRDLIRDGFLGDVESTSVTAFSSRGADPVIPTKRYLFEQAAGGNLLTIETGHLLDALAFLLGEPASARSSVLTRRPVVPDSDGGTFHPDTADTLITVMLTEAGAPVSVHIAQGTHALVHTDISIIGSKGALKLSTTTPGGIQMATPVLWGSSTTVDPLQLLEVPSDYYRVPLAGIPTAVNVAEALGAFTRDILEGTRTVPDFDDAVARHRMLADVIGSPIF